MTATDQTYFIPMLPAPFARGCSRISQERWQAWRDGFAFWMDFRGAEPPGLIRAYHVRVVVRRGVGPHMTVVDQRHIDGWRDAIRAAARRWAGREPESVVVSFEPLEGPATTARERKTGVYLTIEEDR